MSKTRASKQMKALGLWPRAFICFSVFGTRDEALALVFDILLEILRFPEMPGVRIPESPLFSSFLFSPWHISTAAYSCYHLHSFRIY